MYSVQIINRSSEKKKEETEEEKAKKTLSFVERHKSEIEKFGMLRDYHISRDYLRDNPHLVCDETASYLTLWCVNLEVEEVGIFGYSRITLDILG